MTAPASQGSSMVVQPYGWASKYEVAAGHWSPRHLNSPMPGVGTQCLLIFDHLGDAWVPCWEGPGEGLPGDMF